MFGSTKHTKPLAQVLREKNFRDRFVSELTKNEDQLINRSLDSVQTALLEKKPTLKQTKLYIRRSLKRPHAQLNDSFNNSEQMETKTELFIMPSPKMKVLQRKAKLNNTICVDRLEKPSYSNTKTFKETSEDIRKSPLSNNVMTLNGRNMQVLVGKVDFALKIMKMHPNINVLWDVYDSFVRVVGHISDGYRLRAFKIQNLKNTPIPSSFTRIQNVNSFVLLQNQTNNDV
ncbi:uncharacterized protein ACRADG_010377 isoform 2-T2 [Cochliomyia hominivorax]